MAVVQGKGIRPFQIDGHDCATVHFHGQGHRPGTDRGLAPNRALGQGELERVQTTVRVDKVRTNHGLLTHVGAGGVATAAHAPTEAAVTPTGASAPAARTSVLCVAAAKDVHGCARRSVGTGILGVGHAVAVRIGGSIAVTAVIATATTAAVRAAVAVGVVLWIGRVVGTGVAGIGHAVAVGVCVTAPTAAAVLRVRASPCVHVRSGCGPGTVVPVVRHAVAVRIRISELIGARASRRFVAGHGPNAARSLGGGGHGHVLVNQSKRTLGKARHTAFLVNVLGLHAEDRDGQRGFSFKANAIAVDAVHGIAARHGHLVVFVVRADDRRHRNRGVPEVSRGPHWSRLYGGGCGLRELVGRQR